MKKLFVGTKEFACREIQEKRAKKIRWEIKFEVL